MNTDPNKMELVLLVQDQVIGRMVPIEINYDFINEVDENQTFRIMAIAHQITKAMRTLKSLRDLETK